MAGIGSPSSELAGDRWFAAALLIIGSTVGGVMALFVAPSMSNADLIMCVAASITIMSHWFGRWSLRRVSVSSGTLDSPE